MGRYRLYSLALLLILPACVDTTAPQEDHVGRYTLRRINGAAPPGAVLESSVARLDFLSGILHLRADLSFVDSTRLKVTPLRGGEVQTVTDVAAGTYRISNDTLHLQSTRGEEYHMVRQTAGSLVQDLSGVILIYRK
ncbi:MAG TPA: hypothetical protein VGC44_13500 [Longimicrobiales bacterium]